MILSTIKIFSMIFLCRFIGRTKLPQLEFFSESLVLLSLWVELGGAEEILQELPGSNGSITLYRCNDSRYKLWIYLHCL